MNNHFLPKKFTTKATWKQLLISDSEFQQIKKLEAQLNNNDFSNGKNHVALFHGPLGTGKTLTASLLGKYTNRDVYRIDLSLVVSKYIGETEKNLATIFDKFQEKDAILFFDEADAIFGKRTNVNDAHDSYANQQVSYLMQRTKNHPGLVIISIDRLKNITETFKKSFSTIIEFKRLSLSQRYVLRFKNYFR